MGLTDLGGMGADQCFLFHSERGASLLQKSYLQCFQGFEDFKGREAASRSLGFHGLMAVLPSQDFHEFQV